MSETSLVKTETTTPTATARPDVRTVRPAADLVRTEQGYRLTVDLPGIAADDLDVHLEKGVLTITAEPTARDEDGWESLHGTGGAQRYERHFPFGDEIDPENIEARMKAGVLTVTLPRPASPGRRISVDAGK
jgi:HSP20 family molecular chaperone IbpA